MVERRPPRSPLRPTRAVSIESKKLAVRNSTSVPHLYAARTRRDSHSSGEFQAGFPRVGAFRTRPRWRELSSHARAVQSPGRFLLFSGSSSRPAQREICISQLPTRTADSSPNSDARNDNSFLTGGAQPAERVFWGVRPLRLAGLFGLVVAGFAASRAVVKAIMAEPHVDLALAQAAVFPALTALFAHLALGADEFCLGCHERTLAQGVERPKCPW